MYPSYLKAYNDATLTKAAEQALRMLESCSICPRRCGINRLKNERGFCKTGLKAQVYSHMAHHGEEPAISGKHGSGTIFFAHCNMACVYCQNFEFSQAGEGREVGPEELANIMLKLQETGCHNINLVTPTHVMPQILAALPFAVKNGLKIPLVYNTSGYELAEVLRLLEGIVDIYLPDMRYADEKLSGKYSSAPDYPEYNRLAVKEMHRQVGVADIDQEGIIRKGLVIRHLVLPDNISGTKKIMDFIAKELSPETYVSLMSQYTPYFKAAQFKELGRRVSFEEFAAAEEAMYEAGLHNGWTQDAGGLERFAGVNIKPTH